MRVSYPKKSAVLQTVSSRWFGNSWRYKGAFSFWDLRGMNQLLLSAMWTAARTDRQTDGHHICMITTNWLSFLALKRPDWKGWRHSDKKVSDSTGHGFKIRTKSENVRTICHNNNNNNSDHPLTSRRTDGGKIPTLKRNWFHMHYIPRERRSQKCW